MAIVQISRIQVRRGQDSDVPQLASGEFGWSIDKRRLYIGNGTLGEGAPTEGRTEILTQYSNFLEFVNTYTFQGTNAGYTSITGATKLNPVLRSLQAKLDETVSVQDFGATGNGLTDDFQAIQRAIKEIYVSGLSTTVATLRRTIYFPAGTYFISQPIPVPPNCTIVGAGKSNTILYSTTGTVFTTADSKYNTGTGLGTNSAVLPANISVSRLAVSKNASTADPVAIVDSTTNISFSEVSFIGNSTAAQLVKLASSINPCKTVVFDRCVFTGGVNAVRAFGQPSTNVVVQNSVFSGQSGIAIVTDANLVGFVSQGNEYNSVVPFSRLSGNNYSIGDRAAAGTAGIHLGSAIYSPGGNVSLSGNAVTTVTSVAVGSSGTVDYQLTDNTNYRFGTIKYAVNSSGLTYFNDDYTETSSNFLSANVFLTSTGNLTCSVNSTAVMHYNIKNFS